MKASAVASNGVNSHQTAARRYNCTQNMSGAVAVRYVEATVDSLKKRRLYRCRATGDRSPSNRAVVVIGAGMWEVR